MMKRLFRTPWLFRVHLLLLLPALIAAAYLTVDIVVHLAMADPTPPVSGIVQLVIGLVIAPLTVGVGLFCVQRVPGNVVGPILALWGCGIIDIISDGMYATGNQWVIAFRTVYAGVIWPACFFLFSYFPDGRVYPRRFGKAIDGLVLFTYILAILIGLSQESGFGYRGRNLVFIAALEPLNALAVFGNAAGAGIGLLFSLISLTLRFRAASLPVRQQIKWLLAGLLPLGLLTVPSLILQQVPAMERVGEVVGELMAFWLMTFPVVAIGNALLRHRLYDIDIIIRRTLVYSTLTAALALVYLGTVLVLQQLFRPLLGLNNDLAVVASTLAIAALFQPLRRRIQALIDHRFYRRKYDAQKTVHAFSVRLREETNLDELCDDLLQVVQATLQPAHSILWMREGHRHAVKQPLEARASQGVSGAWQHPFHRYTPADAEEG
jgi:hypothetical protein